MCKTNLDKIFYNTFCQVCNKNCPALQPNTYTILNGHKYSKKEITALKNFIGEITRNFNRTDTKILQVEINYNLICRKVYAIN